MNDSTVTPQPAPRRRPDGPASPASSASPAQRAGETRPSLERLSKGDLLTLAASLGITVSRRDTKATIRQRIHQHAAAHTGTGDATDTAAASAGVGGDLVVLDVSDVNALLVVARRFAAAAEVAFKLEGVAAAAHELPDALTFGPGTQAVEVILRLAELAPDAVLLGQFAAVLGRLVVELSRQVNRNEHIASDQLAGDVTQHVPSGARDAGTDSDTATDRRGDAA